ncbi:MAG: hypothetical protein QOG77_1314 [Solirubrobacteraceae bacterium]|nr:hypothetical protein [Solirubrobacteraceae bacterium]
MSHRSSAGGSLRSHTVRAAWALPALAALALLGGERADAASVGAMKYADPYMVCGDVKEQRKALRFEMPADGEHLDDTLGGSYTVDGTRVDWRSEDLDVDYVLVSGEGGTNVYDYPGGSTKSDDELYAPAVGDYPGKIHAVAFCYDNDDRGRLVVKKVAPEGSTERFTFHASYDLTPDFDLAGGEKKYLRPKAGRYTIEEEEKAGWKVDSISCDDDDSSGYGRTLTANVDAGETVTCTFYNVKDVPPVVPPVVPPKPVVEVTPETPAPGPAPAAPAAIAPAAAPAPPAPQQAVRGVQITQARGRASLQGPRRCVADTFRVTVSGSPVRRIAFTVNGRAVRTVNARSGQRTFTVTLPSARGKAQQVRARITFANGARSRTLRAGAVRCAERQVVQPQFTG